MVAWTPHEVAVMSVVFVVLGSVIRTESGGLAFPLTASGAAARRR